MDDDSNKVAPPIDPQPFLQQIEDRLKRKLDDDETDVLKMCGRLDGWDRTVRQCCNIIEQYNSI